MVSAPGHLVSSIEVSEVVINDLFSAGDRVAFRVTQTGVYRGGLPGLSPDLQSHQTLLRCAGIAHIRDGIVGEVLVITDRLGARALLLKR